MNFKMVPLIFHSNRRDSSWKKRCRTTLSKKPHSLHTPSTIIIKSVAAAAAAAEAHVNKNGTFKFGTMYTNGRTNTTACSFVARECMCVRRRYIWPTLAHSGHHTVDGFYEELNRT